MKKRCTLYGLAGLGPILIWYFFVFAPTANKLDSVHQAIVDVERQLDDYNHTFKKLPEFLRANKNFELLRSELNSSLFAKSDILELFRQLSQDADKFRLDLVEISPPVSELLELNRLAVIDNEPQFLNVTLDFKGRYVDFGRFVSHLESKPYFRAINTCFIRGTQTLQPTVDLSVSFKALIGTVEDQA